MTPRAYDLAVRDLDQGAMALDALLRGDAASRRLGFEMLRDLVDAFVRPAASHLSADGDGHRAFDLERAAGAPIPGLALGLLAREIPGLRAPSDAALAAALGRLGLEIDGPERRAAFFQAWTAQRVSRLIPLALAAESAETPQARARERALLEDIASAPLADLDRRLIATAVRRRSA
jgi:hypothetical protein